MIRLKNLITEENVFTLAPTDAWEYKYDMKNTGIPWWTRKKGTEEWIDMKSVLSTDKYKQAVTTLANAIKNKTYIKIKPEVKPINVEPDYAKDPSRVNELHRMDNGYLISSKKRWDIVSKGSNEYPARTFLDDPDTKKLLYGKPITIRSGIGAYDKTADEYKNSFRGFKDIKNNLVDLNNGTPGYGSWHFTDTAKNAANLYINNVKKGDVLEDFIIKDVITYVAYWIPGNANVDTFSTMPIITTYAWAVYKNEGAWYPTSWISISGTKHAINFSYY